MCFDLAILIVYDRRLVPKVTLAKCLNKHLSEKLQNGLRNKIPENLTTEAIAVFRGWLPLRIPKTVGGDDSRYDYGKLLSVSAHFQKLSIALQRCTVHIVCL